MKPSFSREELIEDVKRRTKVSGKTSEDKDYRSAKMIEVLAFLYDSERDSFDVPVNN